MQLTLRRRPILSNALVILVLLIAVLTVGRAFCQSTQPNPVRVCSMQWGIDPSLTANWTPAQKEILENQVLPMIQKRIAKHWKLPKRDALFGLPELKMCVLFKLNAYGSITGARMVQFSKVADLDQGALSAVNEASPLDPFPAAVPVKSLSVSYLFIVNQSEARSFLPYLSDLPSSFEESGASNANFPIVVSVHPSLTEPLAALKKCCMEKWAEAVQTDWASRASFWKDRSLVEVKGCIEPDGTVDQLEVTTSSENERLDRAAVQTLTDNKLVIQVTLDKAVEFRVDFLAHQKPSEVIIAPPV